MKDEAQQIAIAQARGIDLAWNDIRGRRNRDLQPPDYLNDLNAMHEVIEWLCQKAPDIVKFRSNEHLFEEQLDMICDREEIYIWRFSAALFAEAFLRTIGKWEVSLDEQVHRLHEEYAAEGQEARRIIETHGDGMP